MAGHRARSVAAAEAHNSTTNLVTDHDSEDEMDPISAGDAFRYEGHLYKVASVNADKGTATCVRFLNSAHHPAINISLAEVIHLVQDHA